MPVEKTTISTPPEMKEAAMRKAASMGIYSFSGAVRLALAEWLIGFDSSWAIRGEKNRYKEQE